MKRTKPRKKSKVVKLEKPGKVYTLKELKEMLTEKQKVFCHEYCSNGWNATKASKAARYSEITGRSTACRLLTKHNIKQYIEFIKTDYEKLCGISKARQLNEYIKIAYSNISAYNDSWIDLKTFEEIPEEELAAIQDKEYKTETRIIDKEVVDIVFVKIKLHPKITALQRIDKLMGYEEPEKVQHSGEIKSITTVDTSKYTKEEKEFMLRIARKAND